MNLIGNKMGGSKKLIIFLIAICASASGICFYLARTHFSEPFPSTAPSRQPPGPAHQLISFDQQGRLVGVSMKQGRFVLDRFHLESGPEHAEVAIGADPAQWLVGPDGITLAWLSAASQVSVQRASFPDASGERLPWQSPQVLKVPSDLVTFGVLSDGTIAFVFGKGELLQRDPTGQTPEVRLALLGRVSWAQIRGDYAVVAVGNKLQMYRVGHGAWTMVEERPDFLPGSDRRLPADGQIVAIVAGGVRVGEETLNTPGKVSDVVMSDQGFVLVSGEFPGIVGLPAKSDPYVLADSPARSQIAASRNALAYTTPAGTVLMPLFESLRLTETGRLIVAVGSALVILAVLGALLLLLIDGKGMEPKRGSAHDLKDAKLPKPPPDLIKAVSSGEATLWAGAGLSAGSGFPLRNAFISSIFQTALIENWQTPVEQEPYWKLVTDGKQEEALDRFLTSNPANRIRATDLARSTYSRFSTVNANHRLLANLPFNAAITSNYDCLLERCAARWSRNTARWDGGARLLALGSHLTVKLFGDFEIDSRAILGRQDFKSAVAASPEFVGAFGDLFESRPILFVGTSLDGLLEDLAVLKVARPTEVKHYCIAGVGTVNWKPKANALKSRHNIEVFPCDVLNIQEELKRFLTELNAEVDAVRGDEAPQVAQPVGLGK